jgi:hypothetical protein
MLGNSSLLACLSLPIGSPIRGPLGRVLIFMRLGQHFISPRDTTNSIPAIKSIRREPRDLNAIC